MDISHKPPEYAKAMRKYSRNTQYHKASARLSYSNIHFSMETITINI